MLGKLCSILKGEIISDEKSDRNLTRPPDGPVSLCLRFYADNNQPVRQHGAEYSAQHRCEHGTQHSAQRLSQCRSQCFGKAQRLRRREGRVLR